MPTTQQLIGYYRLNPARMRRLYAAKDVKSDQDLIRKLKGVMGESTFLRMVYDDINPSSRAQYALTTYFGVTVEDIFDPVPGEIPARRQREPRSA